MCSAEQLAEWVVSQIERLRERGLFDASAQLELAEIVLRATGGLSDDHCVALTSEGLLRAGDVATWAAEQDDILLSHGGPCEWETRPPALRYRDEGRSVVPPAGWLVFAVPHELPTFAGLLPQRRGGFPVVVPPRGLPTPVTAPAAVDVARASSRPRG